MSTLKKLLMAATVLTAVTGSAHAEVVNKQWNMDYFPEVFNGACIAGSHYEKSKVTLNFGKIYRDGTTKWAVMLSNKSWPTKEDGEYEVVMYAGVQGAPKSTLKTLTKVFIGLKGGLVVNDLSADEMNTLAFDGDAVVWFVNKKDNKVIANLNINRSAEAIRALGACLKRYVANNTNTPKTEFANQTNAEKRRQRWIWNGLLRCAEAGIDGRSRSGIVQRNLRQVPNL